MRRILIPVVAIGAAILPACGDDDEAAARSSSSSSSRARPIDIFEELVADFEAENPDIDIEINNVPNADAAIRTRLVRGDMPDVMTLNGSGRFSQLARADVFYDFSAGAGARHRQPGHHADPRRPRHQR